MELNLPAPWTAAYSQKLTFQSFERIGVGWLGSQWVEKFGSYPKFTSPICPLTQDEEYTTVAIMDLNLHLEELIDHAEVGVAARILQK